MAPKAHSMRKTWGRPGRRRGFTMIELLVVMLILAILISLVVGVATLVRRSGQEKETRKTQALVMAAVQAFHDAGWRDSSGSLQKEYPPNDDWTVNPTPPTLLWWLRGRSPNANALGDPNSPGVKRAQEVLQRQAWNANDASFRDGYGSYMRYERDGGRGGGPVVISPGPDRLFGDEGYLSAAQQAAAKADNIRSDEN